MLHFYFSQLTGSGVSTSSDSSSTGTAAQVTITQEALIAVLQRIGLEERLTTCALVCRSWNAAAAAATSTDKLIVSEHNAENLEWWLFRHAQQFVSNLDIAARTPATAIQSGYLPLPGLRAKLNPFATTTGRWIDFQLPLLQLPQLKRMQLAGVQLTWHSQSAAAASEAAGDSAAVAAARAEAVALEAAAAAGAELCSTAASLAALTSLTALTLHSAKLCCCKNGVCGLWAFTSLQQLHLAHEDASLCEAANMILPYLSSLTSLTLTQNVDRTGFSEVSCLVHLQSLQLQPHPAVGKTLNPPSLVTVPPNLKELTVTSSSVHGDEISRQSVPGLDKCTALQSLTLQRVAEVDIVTLGERLQLTRLDVQVHAFNRQHLAKLLRALPGMQQLRSMRIHRLSLARGWDWSTIAEAAAEDHVRQHCTSLMALNQLTSLELLNIPWASGVRGGDIFQAGRPLPKLVSLTLSWNEIDLRLEEFGVKYVELFNTADINNLADCCPSLRQLDLCEEVRSAANLSGLLRLSGLAQLTLGGEQIDNSTVEQLLQLTGLRSLAVNPASSMSASGKYPRSSPRFDDWGLHCLTALTGLTKLEAFSEGFSKELRKKHVVLVCEAGSNLPVCQQLERRCTASMLLKHKKQQQQQQRPQRTQSDQMNRLEHSSRGVLPRAMSAGGAASRSTTRPPAQTHPQPDHASQNGTGIELDSAGPRATAGGFSTPSQKKAVLLKRIALLQQMLAELEAEVATL